MASTWLGSSGDTAYLSSSLVPATYICFCAPGTLVINSLNSRAEKLVAMRIPMTCNVGGAKPNQRDDGPGVDEAGRGRVRFGGMRDLRQPHHGVVFPDGNVARTATPR